MTYHKPKLEVMDIGDLPDMVRRFGAGELSEADTERVQERLAVFREFVHDVTTEYLASLPPDEAGEPVTVE